MQFEGALPNKADALCVGCQAGKRSEMAAAMLSQAGYTNLKNVEGGFAGKSGSWGGSVLSCCSSAYGAGALKSVPLVFELLSLQPGLEPTCRWRSEPALRLCSSCMQIE